MNPFKESKIKKFKEVLNSIKDEDYKNWLKRNLGTFICKPNTQKKAYLSALDREFEKSLPMPEFKKSEIYFADLSPDKSSKIRPVLIYQNNKLNKAVKLNLYHNIIVIPITSRLLGGDYRVRIEKRDKLIKDSEIVCNAIGIVSADRILFKKGLVTSLKEEEEREVEKKLSLLFGWKIKS